MKIDGTIYIKGEHYTVKSELSKSVIIQTNDCEYHSLTIVLNNKGHYLYKIDGAITDISKFEVNDNVLSAIKNDLCNMMINEYKMIDYYFANPNRMSPIVYSMDELDDVKNTIPQKKYQRDIFSIAVPTKEKVNDDLEKECNGIGISDTLQRRKYIDDKIELVYQDRINKWDLLKTFFNEVQDNLEYKFNMESKNEYESEIKKIDDMKTNDIFFIKRKIEYLASQIKTPFAADLEFEYCDNGIMTLDLILPSSLSIPRYKAILNNGTLTILDKTNNELRNMMTNCVLSSVFLVIAYIFNVSVYIKIINITVWLGGHEKGLGWLTINRDNQLVKHLNHADFKVYYKYLSHLFKIKDSSFVIYSKMELLQSIANCRYHISCSSSDDYSFVSISEILNYLNNPELSYSDSKDIFDEIRKAQDFGANTVNIKNTTLSLLREYHNKETANNNRDQSIIDFEKSWKGYRYDEIS